MKTTEEKLDSILGKITLMQRDMQMLRARVYGPDVFVMNMDHPQRDVANSLIKKITGRSFKPGEIIRLTNDEFTLYQDLLPCPPRNL